MNALNDLDLALMLNPNDEHLKEEIKKFRALMGKLLEKIQNSYNRDEEYNSDTDQLSQDSAEYEEIQEKKKIEKKVVGGGKQGRGKKVRRGKKVVEEGYDIEELKAQHAETRLEIQSIVKFLEAKGNDFIKCLHQLGLPKEAVELQSKISNALSSNSQYEKFLSLTEDSKEEEITKIAKKLKFPFLCD